MSLEIDFLKLRLLWIQFQWTFPSQWKNIVFLYNCKKTRQIKLIDFIWTIFILFLFLKKSSLLKIIGFILTGDRKTAPHKIAPPRKISPQQIPPGIWVRVAISGLLNLLISNNSKYIGNVTKKNMIRWLFYLCYLFSPFSPMFGFWDILWGPLLTRFLFFTALLRVRVTVGDNLAVGSFPSTILTMILIQNALIWLTWITR